MCAWLTGRRRTDRAPAGWPSRFATSPLTCRRPGRAATPPSSCGAPIASETSIPIPSRPTSTLTKMGAEVALPMDVALHELTAIGDHRGTIVELDRQSWHPDDTPLQWTLSRSGPDVLRGPHVHKQHTDRLVVLDGELLVGLVDLRRESSTAGLRVELHARSAAGPDHPGRGSPWLLFPRTDDVAERDLSRVRLQRRSRGSLRRPRSRADVAPRRRCSRSGIERRRRWPSSSNSARPQDSA